MLNKTYKLAAELLSGFGKCLACIFFIFEQAKAYSLSVNYYPRPPLLFFLEPVNAFELAGAPGSFGNVPTILSAGCWSEVVPRVVKSIPVPVVALLAVVWIYPFANFHMHIDGSGFPLSFLGEIYSSEGIPAKPVQPRLFMSMPLPLHQPVIINSINSGKFSLSQWNSASTFFHSSSIGGSVLFDDEPACRSRIKSDFK